MNMRSIIYLCLILPLATLVVQAQDRGAVIIDQRNVVDTLPPEREYPELPVVLQQRLEAIRHSKQTLVDALKKVLEENVDATAEQRKAAAEAWRQANTDRLTNQRHEATLARLEVKAWLEANRPERPLPQEIESAASITTVQREEQLAAMKQRQTDIQAENKQIAAAIQEAVTEDERREIIAQHRTQRLEQIQDQQRLQDLRSDKLDRQSSLTNIQNTLRRNAESIRIQNRLDARTTDPRLDTSTLRSTAADARAATVQRQTDSVVRPDAPDRPVTVDRQTLNADRPSATDGTPDSRREILRETRN
ncbi:MAG: hypothetical protein ACI9TH_000304 [Kiritimatiellia bacterium]|jgi:hypothetical protein